MSEPGFFSRLMGHLAFELAEIQPFLLTYLHIILSAIFPIVTASHASVSRPNSAAKPKKDGTDTNDDEDDTEDKDEYQRMEGLTLSDAFLFPVIAGVVLTGLYYLIKWMDDPALLNRILNAYFAVAGLYGVCKFISDTLHVIHAFAFPTYYIGGAGLWHVDQTRRKTILSPVEGQDGKTRDSPMPGLFSLVPLPQKVIDGLWAVRGITTRAQKLNVRFYIHRVVAFRTQFDYLNIIGIVIGSFAVLYFNLVDRAWWLTNLMGFSFSYSSLQLMSPTTFVTGGMLLIGLFLYDIYMVFFTPMMVTVAKTLDIPIKLLFPRPSTSPDRTTQDFAMLGLGDIVLPGLMIALSLRYDLYLHYLRLQTKQQAPILPNDDATTGDSAEKEIIIKAPYTPPSRNWSSRFWTSSHPSLTQLSRGTFPKPYFTASLTGYIIGMVATLLGMHFSHHPQPALLYLVPGVLGAIALTALVRRETSLMWSFSEEEEDEEHKEDKNQAAPGDKAPGKRSLADSAQNRPSSSSSDNDAPAPNTNDSPTSQPSRRDSVAKVERLERAFRATRDRELVHLSVSRPSRATKRAARVVGVADGPAWVEAKASAPKEEETGLQAGHVAKKLRTA